LQAKAQPAAKTRRFSLPSMRRLWQEIIQTFASAGIEVFPDNIFRWNSLLVKSPDFLLKPTKVLS
jgi:hypothetical protein